MNKENALKKSIVYKLRLRIILASIVIAVVFSIYASYIEKKNVFKHVLESSLNQALTLNSVLFFYLDHSDEIVPSGLDKLVTKFASIRFEQQAGAFVYLDIYDTNNKLLSRSVDRTYPYADYIIRKVSETRKADINIKGITQTIFELNGVPHIHMQKPLFNSKKQAVLMADAVFAISDSQLATMQYKVIKIIFYVCLIVIITSFVLYPIIIDLVNRLTRYSADLLESNLEIVKVLGSAIAKRDSDTDVHNYRVTIYSVKLAEEIKLPAKEIQKLMKGAFLHDVGKIGIRDNILLKPGRHTVEEFEIMKTHVNHGIDIIGRSTWLKDAIDVVESHHEKVDGSGYPNGIKGDDIPMIARIFAIADVFDALTSKRPYKDPFSYEKSISIIQEGNNQHFDSILVDKFTLISKALYDKYAGRDDKGVKSDLTQMLHKYFDHDFSISKY